MIPAVPGRESPGGGHAKVLNAVVILEALFLIAAAVWTWRRGSGTPRGGPGRGACRVPGAPALARPFDFAFRFLANILRAQAAVLVLQLAFLDTIRSAQTAAGLVLSAEPTGAIDETAAAETARAKWIRWGDSSRPAGASTSPPRSRASPRGRCW